MRKTLLLLTMTALTVASFAQNAKNRWNVGAGVAFTDFVNPINGQYLMLERYKGAFNANIQRYLGKSFDGRVNFTYGSIYYPYDNASSSGNTRVPDPIKKGDMSYLSAEMWDLGANLVYKFANGYIMKENAVFSPYIYSGVGANLINSVGVLGGAGTDNVNPYIPVGVGFKYDISDNWNAALETSYNFALGESYSYTKSAVRLGYNLGSKSLSSSDAVASSEPMPNDNWCAYGSSIGAGASFVSFEGPITEQNFLLDQFTTLLSVNYQKRLSRAFDVRFNPAFGNVWYPVETDATTTFPDNNKFKTGYASAQMLDLTVEGVFRFAGSLLKENAIFSPYLYAGPSVNWITSIGSWNMDGADDINMNISTGLGFNFRTSDRFSIQLEGGRKWNLDNSFSYNQANLRGMYSLGKCVGSSKSTTPTTPEQTKTPDSDADGVMDNVDECPYVAGKPEFFGCPDSDGDGIGDSKDKCPFDKGVASNQGCPEVSQPVETKPEVVTPPANTETIKIDGGKKGKTATVVQAFEVYFANGTNYSPGQVETLQQVATLLKNNPNYSVRINGNTYKGGSKALSLQRAQKVAGTLRMKGVNTSKAMTQGFGDTRPKYNDAKDNRAEIEVITFE